MKSASKIFYKTCMTLLAVGLFFLGFMGFMISAMYSMGQKDIEKYYKQHPLNDKRGIAVDSSGNIYIGEGQTGSIQVYDSQGNFQYGFSFPTGGAGWFDFGIEQDKIHIVTARTDSYFIFDRGELVYCEEGINYNRSKNLQAKYNMAQSNSFDIGNKVYKISSFNTVLIQDNTIGNVEKIYLNTPLWPLSFGLFWVIGVCGMGLIYVLHHKFFSSITQRRK